MKSLHFRAKVDGSIVSSVIVHETPVHWYINVWNRGAKSGTLIVDSKDGPYILNRILPEDQRDEVKIQGGDV